MDADIGEKTAVLPSSLLQQSVQGEYYITESLIGMYELGMWWSQLDALIVDSYFVFEISWIQMQMQIF